MHKEIIMFSAHGEQPLVNVLFISALAAMIVLGTFIGAKKPRTFAVTFAAVILLLSGVLLWLIFRPH
jgi:uncharacterized membrane protein YfcA